MLFKEWAIYWLKYYKSNELRLKTYDIYNNLITNYFIPSFGNIKLNNIDMKIISKYINNNKNKLSNNTLNLHITLIKSIMNCAYDNNIIKKNNLKNLKRLSSYNKEINIFSSLEREKSEIQKERLKLEYDKWYFGLSDEEKLIHDEKTNNAKKEILNLKEKINEIDEQLNELETQKSKEVLSCANIINQMGDYNSRASSGIMTKLIIFDVIIQFIIDCVISVIMIKTEEIAFLFLFGVVNNIIVAGAIFAIITSKKTIDINNDNKKNMYLNYYVPTGLLSVVMLGIAFFVVFILASLYENYKEISIIIALILIVAICVALYTVIHRVIEDCSDKKSKNNEYKHAIEVQNNKSKEFDDDINKLYNEKYDLETKIDEILEEHYWLKY